MDCPHYLKQLDAVPIGSTDHDDPGVREAIAHLSDCENCAREFEARREFDRQVAVQMRDVPVPAEARARLSRQLRRADVVGVTAEAPSAAGARLPRWSLVWKTIGTIAALLLIWSVVPDPRPTKTMDEVDAAVAEQFAGVTVDQYGELAAFDGSFEPSIDDGRWERVTNRNPRGIDLNEDGKHDAAVYWIDRAGGVLLVVSPGLVADPPTNTTPQVAPRYSPVRVAWLPAGSTKVHLCVLNSQGDDDGDLRRLLHFVIDAMAA